MNKRPFKLCRSGLPVLALSVCRSKITSLLLVTASTEALHPKAVVANPLQTFVSFWQPTNAVNKANVCHCRRGAPSATLT